MWKKNLHRFRPTYRGQATSTRSSPNFVSGARGLAASTGTVFRSAKKPLSTYLQYVHCMMRGMFVRETAESCGMGKTNAFYMRHNASARYSGSKRTYMLRPASAGPCLLDSRWLRPWPPSYPSLCDGIEQYNGRTEPKNLGRRGRWKNGKIGRISPNYLKFKPFIIHF